MAKWTIKTLYRPDSGMYYGHPTHDLTFQVDAETYTDAQNMAIDETYKRLGGECSHVQIHKITKSDPAN